MVSDTRMKRLERRGETKENNRQAVDLKLLYPLLLVRIRSHRAAFICRQPVIRRSFYIVVIATTSSRTVARKSDSPSSR